MKFNKLDVPYQWKDEFTKYPHGYTIFEALCSWTKQVDKMVDNINDWNDYLDNFVENFEFELQEEVKSTITRWQNEGLLDDIIASALNTELDNVKADLAEKVNKGELVINVKDYGALGDNIKDDTGPIQWAIDYAYSMDGGTVYIPAGIYKINGTIHVKENVKLLFSENATFSFDNTTETGMIYYRASGSNGMRLTFGSNFNGYAVLFDSAYLRRPDNKDKAPGERITIENFEIISTTDGTKTNKKAIRLQATDAGFWGIKMSNGSIRGFDVMFSFETFGTGWINGNTFSDITVVNFVNVVETTKSASSRGIDYNFFRHLVVQCGELTRDLFLDSDSKNVYSELELYDEHLFKKNIRIGNANIVSKINNFFMPMQVISRKIDSDGRYYHIGRFLSWPNSSRFIILNFRGKEVGKISTDIAILGHGFIHRNHFGSQPLTESKIMFYRKENADGSNDIFVKSLLSSTLETVITYGGGGAGFTLGNFNAFTDNDLGSVKEIDNNVNRYFTPNAAGNTRPSEPIPYQIFFDKTLNKPIWWNGETWVDATGATV